MDPAIGAESSKRRPAVIVSNDGANTAASRLGRGVVTVVPVTSNTKHLYPFQVLIAAGSSGLTRSRKPKLSRSVPSPVARVGARVGALSGADLLALDDALRLHLAL